MAIASIGYEGSVGEAEWARYGQWFTLPKGLSTPTDLALTISGLNLSVGPGVAYGDNVVDVVGLTTVTNTAPSSGTRYDTLVLRRDWTATGVTPSGGATGGATTLVVVPGGTAATVSGAVLSNPGAGQSDQPLFLVSTTSAGVQALVADLRSVQSTAALVRSKLAMTGPAGTQYTLKDGSAQDGTRWVMTVTQAGTIAPALEWEPAPPVVAAIATGYVLSRTFNANGETTIAHNLGWAPKVFKAWHRATRTSAPVVLELSLAGSSLTATDALIIAKVIGPTGWEPYTNGSLSRIDWIAVSD